MHCRFPSILERLHVVHGLLDDVVDDFHVPAHSPIFEVVVIDAYLLEGGQLSV